MTYSITTSQVADLLHQAGMARAAAEEQANVEYANGALMTVRAGRITVVAS